MIDNTLKDLLNKEKSRLNNDIELIASENYPSQDILDLEGSVASVKYAEGYPAKRHYAGCEVIDKIENYAIDKAKELFQVNFANVQPLSGTHANTCAYYAFAKPGKFDNQRILSMSLDDGGHLSHGCKFTHSGTFYNFEHYTLTNESISLFNIMKKLYKFNPRILVVGFSAYSKRVDFQKIREIVDRYNKMWERVTADIFKNRESTPIENGWHTLCQRYEGYRECPAYDVKKGDTAESFYARHKCILMVDMAHFAGFVAAHLWKDKYDPTKWADVVTTTTHKTLRGPRSALILWNDETYTPWINQAVFPANAGGPNEAHIAAKAQCFIEALQSKYRVYMEQVYRNMQALLKGIRSQDPDEHIRFIAGGSENHLALLDIRGTGLLGQEAEDRLHSYGIITNKNMIAGDVSPSKCTGLRIGTAAITTRGFTEGMCYELGKCIVDILNKNNTPEGTVDFLDEKIKQTVKMSLEKVGDFYVPKNMALPNPDNIA